MRHYEFTVVFTNHMFKKVHTFNRKDAEILAKAAMISEGLSHNGAFVKDEKGVVV
jgi:hypothetical protein